MTCRSGPPAVGQTATRTSIKRARRISNICLFLSLAWRPRRT